MLVYTALLLALDLGLLAVRASGTTHQAGGKRVRVGLVFDVGGRGDKSFNDSA